MQSRLTRFLRYALLVAIASAAVTVGVHLLEARETSAPLPYPPNHSFHEPQTSVYSMSLVLDTQSHSLSGEETVSYLNNSNAQLSEVVFCLYPNAYSVKAPMDAARYYPEGFSPGSVEILSAAEGDRPVAPRFFGEANEFMGLSLLRPLQPGKRADITIKFRTVIPRNRLRFGRGELGYAITGAYPIAAVYDGAWHTHKYAPFGDPFFHDAASYRVLLTLPEQYAVASTGTVLNESVADGRRTVMLEAAGAREFAFCAGNRYKTYKSGVNGVSVEVYSAAGDAASKNALKIAKNAIKVFESRFGKYPFPRFCVVQSDLLDGGMEYPGLVLIDGSLFKSDMDVYLEHIIVHEAAHQWWYALVGSDQYESPWLDEALTEYSTIIYYYDRYGQKKGDTLYDYFVSDSYRNYQKGLRMDGALNDYADGYEYSAHVYARGAMMYDAVRKKLGDEAFFAALKKYASDYAFKIAKKEDLLRVFGAAGDIFEEYGIAADTPAS